MHLTVLIAEDDKHTRTIMEHIFQKDPVFKDFDVELLLASDGEQALQLFSRNQVDLIISDLLMPKMDGFAFCRAVRDNEKGKNIPIVVTSAIYKETALLNRLRDELHVTFFPKPFQVREFTHEILQLLQESSISEAIPKRTRITMSGPFQGSLDTRSLPALLLDIYEIEGTGVLELNQEKLHKEIYFLFGRPMGSDSNIRHESLGHYLVTKGVLTEKRHQELLAVAKNTRVSFLKALLDAKEFDNEMVMRFHASLVKVRIVNAFRWHKGTYTFTPGDTFSERIPKSPVDPVALVMAGLKRAIDMDEIMRYIEGDEYSHFKFTERFHTLKDEFIRVFGDTVFGHLTTPGATIVDILAKGVDPMSVYSNVFALIESGMCLFIKNPNAPVGNPRPVVEDPLSISNIKKVLYQNDAAENEISVVADIPINKASTSESGLILDIPMEIEPSGPDPRQKLRDFYMDIREKDYFQVLSLSPQSTDDEINSRLDALTRTFSINQYAGIDLGEDRIKLEEILEYLRAAQQTLTDPVKKAQYIQKIQSERLRGESMIDAEMLAKKAEELLDMGRPREAMPLLDKARRLMPDVADFHALYALALHRAREPESSVDTAIQHALEMGPENSTVNVCAGSIAESRQQLDNAVRYLEKALEVDPENLRAFESLERILRTRGNFRILERLYRKLLHLFGNRRPQRTQALARSLAQLYEDKLNDPDKAKAAWEIVHTIAPHDQEAAEALERMSRVRHHLSAEALSDRIEAIRKDILLPEKCKDACQVGFHLCSETLPDLAYLFAAVLEALDATLPESHDFYRRFTPNFLPRAWRGIDADIWQLAQDAEDFPFVSKIFETLGMHIPEGQFFSLAVSNPKILTPSKIPAPWTRVIEYAALQCSLPEIPLILGSPHSKVDLVYLENSPGLFVSSETLAETDTRRIAAWVTRYCTGFWTGRFLPLTATAPQVLQLLKTLIAFVSQKTTAIDTENPLLVLLSQNSTVKPALTKVFAEVASRIGNLNVTNWSRAVQRSSYNVGLLLSQNLPELYKIAPPEIQPGLLAWAISEQHLQARRLMGISIDV